MSQRLLNKVAVITASTDGIGYAIAQKFLKEGSRVLVSSRKSKNVNYAVEQLKKDFDPKNIRGVVCNVGLSTDRTKLIAEAVENFGKIDVLVSNAGNNVHFGSITDCTEEQWDKIFDINLKSTFFLVKETMPHFNKDASIIINSSIGAYFPLPLIGVYSISKSALIGMVKALSTELANSPLEIRVNGIAPGIVKTRFSNLLHTNEAVTSEILKLLHIKRLAIPEDIAGTAAFLASDDAKYITGETIVIAGGLPSRL